MSRRTIFSTGVSPLFLSTCLFLAFCSPKKEDWRATNQSLIDRYGLHPETIDELASPVSHTHAKPNESIALKSLPSEELSPGVKTTLLWGSGFSAAIHTLDAETLIPSESVNSERILLVLEGKIDIAMAEGNQTLEATPRVEPDGVHSATPRMDLMYVAAGMDVQMSAGPSGAKLLEVSSPLRSDHFLALGREVPDQVSTDGGKSAKLNLGAAKVYDLYDLQYTQNASGSFSKVIYGEQIQVNFTSLKPRSEMNPSLVGSERLLIALRGDAEFSLAGDRQPLSEDEAIWIPSNVVQEGISGDHGLDFLEIIWPVSQKYIEQHASGLEKFHEIIPEHASLERIIDGKSSTPELYFTEGPKWMDGKLYFSNMYFDQDWNGDPKQSSTIAMNPDGSYQAISQGKMQTNGLYPYKNGNLLVCDMLGHRVVEMDKTGRVLRVLADEYDGEPLDGPNDIVVDARGGFYFTDPQFTMEAEKFQPGRAVYYVSPEGQITRLTEPNEFAMPNGILLSPDGNTLYINNTYDKESWYPVQSDKDNFVWAFDVQEDGTIRNGRKFSELFLPENVLDRKGKSSGADGMAIDTEGNIYVATYTGVQIFDAGGAYIGTINLPSYPVSLCFGDDDMQTLYIVSYSNVYKIRTNKTGFVQRL